MPANLIFVRLTELTTRSAHIGKENQHIVFNVDIMEWDRRNRSGLVNQSWLGFWIGEASCLQTKQSVEAKFLSSHISPITNSATLLSKFSAQCQPNQLSTYKLQPVLMLRPSLYRSFVANSKPSINSICPWR